jgi:hypothetical protein
MSTEQRYWFPAKRYGWGWGLPSAWQGWAVTLAYFFLMLIGILRIQPGKHPIVFVAFITLLTALLIGVCWVKGEPPSWRWGKR